MTAARVRSAWSRKLTPAQMRVVAQKYYAGSNVREIMAEYRIGRSSLYRYLRAYSELPEASYDATHWRIEVERLKNLVVELALDNKRLRGHAGSLQATCQSAVIS